MKKSFNIVMAICAVMILIGCDNSKTYTDRLNDERKAINRLINREDFKIIPYPEDGVFGEKEFAHLSNGVYFNIVDSGNGNRAVPGSTIVLSRFKGEILLVNADTTYLIDIFDGHNHPLEFTYGGSYNRETDSNGYGSMLYGEGFATPLSYVGDSAIVKLIVPFRVGGSGQTSDYIPVYYSRVRYIFEK
jgi:hypothetical protein